MSNTAANLNENNRFLQSVIECYKSYGLEPAIVYLYRNGVDFETELSVVLKEIYIINDIEFTEKEDVKYHLKNIKNYIKDSQNIFHLNRGYKGEWPKHDIIKLTNNENEIMKSLANIILLINNDINKKIELANSKLSK